MKMSFKSLKFKSFILAGLLAVGLVSCSDDDAAEDGEGTAQLSVSMTDAPGDYEQVLIDVQDVMIQTAAEGDAEADADGWVSVGDVETGQYDLLELTGGVTQLLADTEIPAGYVGQMRLVLGTENYVMLKDGEELEPLSTPSAQQSGLKLNINQELEAGKQYSYLLDFDVEKSIVTTGNGGYSLKPVIRVAAQEGAGTVVGSVHPTNFLSLVTLTDGSNEYSAYTDAEGNFALHGIPAGTYQLQITPAADAGFSATVIDNIVVEENSTLELEETIFLEAVVTTE